MATKVLVIVDVQNDFAKGGSLAYGYPKESNTDAIVAKAKEFIANGGIVIATRDTHHENYLTTLEGQKLPIPHCMHQTYGWQLVPGLDKMVMSSEIAVVDKPTFGTSLVGQFVREVIDKYGPVEEVDVCGYVTSICVLANCVMLRAYMPNQKIVLLEGLCGDVDEESHKAALKVLANQQIEILR